MRNHQRIRRTRKPPRHPSQRDGTFRRIMPFVGILFSLGLIGGIVLYNQLGVERLKIDKLTGCPVKGPQSVTIILIDQTDHFSPVQIVDIRNQLNKIREDIPRYGMISIYPITSVREKIPAPILSVCNPGSEEEVNRLEESGIRARRKWTNVFSDPLDNVFDKVLMPNEAKTSPIFENIQAVSIKEFGDHNRKEIPKSLVVVSDLLQHSNMLSHYKSVGDPDAFIRSKNFQRMRGELRDVEIELIYLFRNTRNSVQGHKHIKFWKRIIESQNGRIRRVYNVSG
jgi:hypothetical protein